MNPRFRSSRQFFITPCPCPFRRPPLLLLNHLCGFRYPNPNLSMEEEIRAEFEKSGFSLDRDDQILQKCLTYCINYKLRPSDLVSNWEIYYLNRHLTGLRVENEHMDGFLSHLQSEMKERIIKEDQNLHIYSSNDIDMLLSDEPHDTKEGLLGTPSSQYERQYMESYNSVSTPRTNEKASSSKESKVTTDRITPFGQRMNKFVSQFVLNALNVSNSLHMPELENIEDDVIRRVQPSERCSLQIYRSQPEPGCRFMYDRTEDKIKKYTSAFAASGLYGEPTDATLASQKNIFAVGMVCCDGEGRLTKKSILLQGSIEHSGGQRVRLDLQKLAQFSLFPGQIIGIEGHNPSGHCLIASKMVDILPSFADTDLPPAKKTAKDQDHQTISLPEGSKVLSLVIAAGPFTTSDNLLFEPLTELLAYASRRQPQLLMLLGPFLDTEHPEIKKGTVDRSFDEIFEVEVIRRLQDYVKYMGSAARLILVPSTRDAHHDFVFPQPAFDIHVPEDVTHQITCLANPGLFSANEVMVGCSTVDVLKQLSSEEISRTADDKQSADRMGRLATHILRQHCYYPLYPPSVGVPFDFSLALEALEIPTFPDVLALPSDLAPFIKVLSLGEGSNGEAIRCMCVNPGRLAKGIGGGTFVELYYDRDPDKTTASIIRI